MYEMILALLCYLIGSIPPAYLVVKYLAGKNVMDYGTGNVGTMNTHRATGNKLLTLLVLIGDLAKGAAAYYLAGYFSDQFEIAQVSALVVAGTAVIIGHNHSLFLKFKGGKGLATGAGFLAFVSPWIVVIWGAICLLTIALTGYFVLGQILATVISPVIVWFWLPEYKWVTLAMCVPIFIKHAPRIRNLRDGSEPKMYYKVRSEDERGRSAENAE